MRRRAMCLVLAFLGLGTLAAPALGSTTPEKAPTVGTIVSLTFDDGWSEQVVVADEMSKRGFRGTFYVSSGQIEYPAFMTLGDLQYLEDSGHEIGGGTLSHASVTDLPLDEAKEEICSDRAALIKLGFRATSFAYPYGDVNADVAKLPGECGYNSARRASGLYTGGGECTECPLTLDPALFDNLAIRTSGSVGGADALDVLKGYVVRAETRGGWLPLVLERVCTNDCDEDSVALEDLVAFLDWLATRPDTTTVQSVEDVVGGDVRPAVGEAPDQVGGLPPFATDGSLTEGPEGSLSNEPAFTVMGYGIGQLQVIGTGIAIALLGVVLYRSATRSKRYL